MLAQLLKPDLLAAVYVSDAAARELKELLRHRVRLVRDASRMKNRIHNLLAKNNVERPAHHQSPLERYLHLYDELRASIAPLDKQVRQRAKEDDQARLSMFLPGVGPVVALTLLARIFHEGHASGCASQRAAGAKSGRAGWRPRPKSVAPGETFWLPKPWAALSAGGWLCRARVQTAPWQRRYYFHNGPMNTGSLINAAQPS